MQRDLTKGNLLKNIVVFSLPFLLSYFLQTLYGMADLFIVGQFDGANVISGVAIGSQVMHMITVMLVGVATGGAVMIGRYVGAHDKENISKTIGNTITLFVIIAAILTALLLLLGPDVDGVFALIAFDCPILSDFFALFSCFLLCLISALVITRCGSV